MRPAAVRRFSVLLLAGLLLAAVAFAGVSRWNVLPPAPEADGSPAGAQFARYCGGCHSVDDLRERTPLRNEQEFAAAEAFLATHTDAPARTNRQVLEMLARR